MSEIKQPTQRPADSLTRTAFWGTMALAVTSLLICSYFFTVLARQPRTAVTYAALAVFLFAIVTAVTGFVLTISGRQELAAKLMFSTFFVIGLAAVTLFQGRTLSASLSILLIAAMTVRWLFPANASRRRYMTIAVAGFLLMWVIEWIHPSWRMQWDIPELGPAAVIGLAFALGWIILTDSRKFLAQSIASSLRLQITVWTAAIIFLVAVITIGYSAYTTRQTAVKTAREEASSAALAEAENVKIQMDPALHAARVLATTLGTVKDANEPIVLTRQQANGILRKVAEENPSFLGTWTLWEPNAFDGLDAEYANTPIHDETGRFIPYWVRTDESTVEGVAIVDYETPGLNDWYSIPRETKQVTLIPPYLYAVEGVDILMTTVSVPIVENGQFYGVTGVDYPVAFVQGIVDKIDLFNGTANAVLFTNDGSLVAVRNQPELALQPATSLFEDFSVIQPQLASGGTLVNISPDGQFLRVFAPVDLLPRGADWSFALVIPLSEITASATVLAVQEVIISLVVIGLALLVLWYLTGLLVRPLGELTSVANAITTGELGVKATITSANETGILAKAFNSMTSQLQETLSGLEQRVADRTRNLELAAEVGRAVSQVRDLDVMLKDACELILKEFNLYYVQVYLTDPAQTALRLEAGTGNVGAQLIGRGHNLPLNTGSINGRAATEKRSVVISDTAQSVTFRQNPLLPETRGEMAVPLIVANEVVGVLDMQSREPGILTPEVLPAFEALAGQLAVAIQNANLLAVTELARSQVEAQARRLVRQGWNEHLNAIHKPEQLAFVFNRHKMVQLAETIPYQPEEETAISAPIAVTGESLGSLVVEIDDETHREQANELVHVVARQVAQQIENLRLLESAERYRYEAEKAARLQTIDGWQKYMESRSGEGLGYFYDTREVRAQGNQGEEDLTMFASPLKAREEVIGRVAVQGWTDVEQESVELVQTVSERLSAHIENLRLFEETRRGQLELEERARQLAAVAEISTASSQELEVDKLLSTVVHLTQRQFNLYHVHVFVYNEASRELQIMACGWKEGDENEGIHETSSIPWDKEQSLVARAARTGRAVIVNDVKREPDWLPNPLLADTAAEMAVPLLIGDRVLGVLDVQSDRINAFSEDDANIQTTLASQVATAMQNARSFTRAQKQAEREAMLNVINQKIQSATSVEAVLQIAARELGHALGAPMTVAQLSMKDRSS
jgi:GAF domain-containing protein/HAMP domain-containing protein